MKTLINKHNPEIRITAPEEAVKERPSCWAIWPEGYKGYRSLLLDKDNWTLVEEEPTCKTCGFYENNCPFIRGKFILYPSRVCKDYIHSAMKEQEQPEVDLEKEIKKHTDLFQADIEYPLRLTAIKFYELGKKGGKI